MLLVFLTCVFVFFSISCIQNHRHGKGKIILAAIYSLLFISAYVVITTEILNLFNAINFTGVLICWIILFLAAFRQWWKYGKPFPRLTLKNKLSGFEKILIGSISGIAIVSLITCFVAYPNNWDSMTYHLGRVMHWIENKNVNQYPTQISRQISQPPLAEYFILQFRLLSDNDRFANLVQWTFMCGSICAVMQIVREIGKSRFIQILAGFICASIPMGILQSNSTQNDYVVGFFITASVLFLIRMIRKNHQKFDILFLIICSALAVTSKGTAFIYLIPVAAISIFFLVWKLKFRSLIWLPIAFLVVAIIFGPYACRNYKTFHNPLGPSYELNNNVYGFAPTISNALKNTAMHLRTPSEKINKGIENSVISIHKALGIDVYTPKFNWLYSPRFEVQYFSTHEDSAGNILHVFLFFICLIALVINKNNRRDKWAWFLFGIYVTMFFTFCFILKWQIWHSRLHLPMFIGASVFIAIIIASFKKIFLYFIFGLLAASSLVFLFLNQSRPWLPFETISQQKNEFGFHQTIFSRSRDEQYFSNNQKIREPIEEISKLIREQNLNDIGMISGGDTWEYPLFVLTNDIKNMRIENLLPENDSRNIELTDPYFKNFSPSGLIITRFPPAEDGRYEYKSEIYSLVYSKNNWSFYISENKKTSGITQPQ